MERGESMGRSETLVGLLLVGWIEGFMTVDEKNSLNNPQHFFFVGGD